MVLKVQIDALHDDAAKWREDFAGPMSVGKTVIVEDYRLTEQLMSWGARKTGALDQYEELRKYLAKMLGEAMDNYDGVANALEYAAYAYQVSDEFGSSRLRGAWTPNK